MSWLLRIEKPVEVPPKENVEGLACWWCTESLPHLPCIHFPIKYYQQFDKFDTIGNFCSWECAKAYGKDLKSPRWGEYLSFLTMMHRRALGRHENFFPAPRREALKKFGGTLTIEEFRNCSGKTCPPIVRFPNETFIEQIIVPGSDQIKHTVSSNAHNSKMKRAIEESESTAEPLKLKRGKPLERSKSKLETSLGIKRKEK
jgi:hypothetical protein